MTAGRVRDHELLMVAGASPGPSASVTAANLAVALARTHSAVILVCPGGQGTAELLGLPESALLDARGPPSWPRVRYPSTSWCCSRPVSPGSGSSSWPRPA